MKIIVVGAGDVGRNLAEKLEQYNDEIILIDIDKNKLEVQKDTLNATLINGSGADPSIIKNLPLEENDFLLAVTASDEVNFTCCYLTSLYNKRISKIAIFNYTNFNDFPEVFDKKGLDIDFCIRPESIALREIEALIDIPGAVEIHDFLDKNYKIIGTRVTRNSGINGKKLSEINQHDKKNRPLFIAIKRKQKIIIPNGDTVIKTEDILYFPSHKSKISQLIAFCGKDEHSPRKVTIMGGGFLGFSLARKFEGNNTEVLLIDKDPNRVDFLKNNLPKTKVIKGNGTDPSLLENENITTFDLFLSLTNDEEANILGSLQAKQFGLKKVITKINKISYFPLVSTIGVDIVANPKVMTVNAIINFLKKDKKPSLIDLKNDRTILLDFELKSSGKLCGKRLSEIKFPENSICAMIRRKNSDEYIIPDGSVHFDIGDHIYILCLYSNLEETKKFFSSELKL